MDALFAATSDRGGWRRRDDRHRRRVLVRPPLLRGKRQAGGKITTHAGVQNQVSRLPKLAGIACFKGPAGGFTGGSIYKVSSHLG